MRDRLGSEEEARQPKFGLGRACWLRSASVMFKWLESRRRRRKLDLVPEPREAERDSGEEEYESHEEDDREVGPSGMTRVKTDDI